MCEPKLFILPNISSNSLMTIAEGTDIPFQVKRVFWITSIKKGAIKGEHAHMSSEQLLVCLNGELNITLESISGKKKIFNLSKPNEAVYIPAQFWGKIEYIKDSIVVALASDDFDENDYIRDYSIFKNQKQ